MSSETKFDVGDFRMDPKRPQVFNVRYTPTDEHRREKTGYTHGPAWHCTIDSSSVNDGFETHADAIQWAGQHTSK